MMTGWRQDFHLHPELGFNEHRTSAKVADLLNDFGIIGGQKIKTIYIKVL